MITKKLIHDIVTFCNNYINNENIIFNVCKYPTFISINIEVYTIIDKRINNKKGEIFYYIHDEKDFIQYKQKVLEKLPKLLEKLKEN